MTIEAIGTITIAATSREVLEFVTDLERYRQADTKIVRVLQAADLSPSDTGTVRYIGRVRGVVSPPDRNDVTLARWSRADFVASPDCWVRRLVDFHGWFTCEPTDGGTVVTHGERFSFHRPGRWLMEPYLCAWLQRDLNGEMTRLASALAG